MSASVVVTIDTEPDNQWEMPSGGAPAPLTFNNTRGLRRLIDHLRSLGLPATWLTSYSVARDAASAGILREAAAAGDEIGGHLHAWETPPLTAADARAHPYIYEYDPPVRLAKLRAMTSAIEDAFGRRPVSYRAGRWGIDELEWSHLAGEGYEIDSSVVPGHDFSRSRGLRRGGPDFTRLLDGAAPNPYRAGSLWEAPLSTTAIGALGPGRLGAALARSVHQRTGLAGRAAKRALAASGLCRMVWVRPLAHPRSDLVEAALSLVGQGARVINIMFHSSETSAGCSPRTRTSDQVERFYGDLDAVARALLLSGDVTPRTLSDAVRCAAAGPTP